MAHSPVPSAVHDQMQRPPLHISKSFSRYEPAAPETETRQRAATMHIGTITDILGPARLRLSPVESPTPDIFESKDDEPTSANDTPISAVEPPAFPDFEDMPIELVSLTDRFIDSIMAKAHPNPPNMDKLAPLFQDFYALAATHIATHISTLSLRQKRRASPPRTSSRSSSIAKSFKTSPLLKTSPSSSRPTSSRSATERMLTMDEMNDRRRQRRALEVKRVAMEEAVERRVCEGVYERIWKHPSTQDDERDEKLRSRTGALSVVGIGLEELGVKFDAAKVLPGQQHIDQKAAELQIKDWLAPAREELMRMNDTHYPIGKLHHLKAAHKSIVEALSRIFPSSSSADEILPMLIYTLITTSTEETNVISNLYFTQRFRNETKIDGEAAYCLTNLEAAVTFVETVDLSTLKADEHPSGPQRPRSGSTVVNPDMLPPARTDTPEASDIPFDRPESIHSVKSTGSGTVAIFSGPTTPRHQRRISQLLQPPTQALGAAGGVVINTADQGLKTIGNTLETSYKFLFGRLRERQVSGAMTDGSAEIVVPKTLDEARKLVSTPPPAEGTDDETAPNLVLNGDTDDPLSAHTDGTIDEMVPLSRSSTEDRLMGLLGGTSMVRDTSRDSSRSGGSGKKVSFSEGRGFIAPEKIQTAMPHAAPPQIQHITPSMPPLVSAASSATIESMRNFGNSINPLNRLASIGVMRPFGRSTSSLPNMTTPTKEKEMLDVGSPGRPERLSGDFGAVADLTTAFPELAPSLPQKDTATTTTTTTTTVLLPPLILSDNATPTQASVTPQTGALPKIAAPVERFMALENPGDLRIGEVLDLLRDYRRLAAELSRRGAFSD